MTTFATIGEIERAAEAVLDRGPWTYLESGSGDEWTATQNRAAFARWQFRPRVCTGNAQPDTSTTVLGIPLSFPVITAPFANDVGFHPDGQIALARGAQRVGTACILSSNARHPFTATRAAAPDAARVLQVSSIGRPETVSAMARRAADAGFSALCITVDADAPGCRDRNSEARFSFDRAMGSGNYTEAELADRMAFSGRGWVWEQIATVGESSGLPWMVKGILSAADARLAKAHGASAVVVSNHGGRQLDFAPASLDVLPEVVREVGAEIPVLLDGGVRRGTDVVKALALGASAVAIGRLSACALAAGGEDGVAQLLEMLRRETANAMALIGRGRVADLDRTALAPAPGWEAWAANQ